MRPSPAKLGLGRAAQSPRRSVPGAASVKCPSRVTPQGDEASASTCRVAHQSLQPWESVLRRMRSHSGLGEGTRPTSPGRYPSIEVAPPPQRTVVMPTVRSPGDALAEGRTNRQRSQTPVLTHSQRGSQRSPSPQSACVAGCVVGPSRQPSSSLLSVAEMMYMMVSTSQAPSAGADSQEGGAFAEAWLAPERRKMRRMALGLCEPSTASLVDQCEFISLGCYCAVSRSLQALGLKKLSYPFDWTRSSMAGVIDLVQDEFEDFFEYSLEEDKGPLGRVFGDTSWDGSFWHHDIHSAKVRADFTRRIDRFLGLREVPDTQARVFVRAVNSTSELSDTLRLRKALRRALPKAFCYLLILIDFQPVSGPLRLTGSAGHDTLFYRIHESLYAQNGAHWSMEKQSEAYAEAIAFATRVWAGRPDAVSRVEEVHNLSLLKSSLMPFEGGKTGSELFFPRRLEAEEESFGGWFSGDFWPPGLKHEDSEAHLEGTRPSPPVLVPELNLLAVPVLASCGTTECHSSAAPVSRGRSLSPHGRPTTSQFRSGSFSTVQQSMALRPDGMRQSPMVPTSARFSPGQSKMLQYGGLTPRFIPTSARGHREVPSRQSCSHRWR